MVVVLLVRGEVDGGVCKGGSRWVGVKKERGGRFYELYFFFPSRKRGKVVDIVCADVPLSYSPSLSDNWRRKSSRTNRTRGFGSDGRVAVV